MPGRCSRLVVHLAEPVLRLDRNPVQGPGVVVIETTAGTFFMAETRTLTDHDAIREWAIARAGKPATQDVPDGTGGMSTALSLQFGQRPTHTENENVTGSMALVEWDDWLKLFDEQELALVVPEEREGVLDSSHQILKR